MENGKIQNQKKRIIANNEKNGVKDHLNNELEEIKRVNEVKLNEITNNYEKTKLNKNENESLDEDIENLRNEIDVLKKRIPNKSILKIKKRLIKLYMNMN